MTAGIKTFFTKASEITVDQANWFAKNDKVKDICTKIWKSVRVATHNIYKLLLLLYATKRYLFCTRDNEIETVWV